MPHPLSPSDWSASLPILSPRQDYFAGSDPLRGWLVAIALSLLCGAALAQEAPGTRSANVSNRTERAHLQAIAGRAESEIRDSATGHTIASDNLFAITLASGAVLRSSSLRWDSYFSTRQEVGAQSARSSADRSSSVCADLSDPHTGARFHWCLLSRPDRSYMQERLTITAAGGDLAITNIELLNFEDPEARVIGTVKGSPVADKDMYFGFENPLSWSRVASGRVEAGISRKLPLREKQSVTESAVLGTYPPGQLRRTFQAFIEQERARPYQPFLNYNTWYDIGYTNRFSEADVLDRIHAFGRELVDTRHVHMDSFVLDDGWDNPNSLWGFDSGFPEVGTPPILTKQGILVLYNGKNAEAGENPDTELGAGAYSVGQALFDANHPTRLLHRLDQPSLHPEKSYERSGQYAAGTTFGEGLVFFRDKWFLYYGCADSFVAVATAPAGAVGQVHLP